MTDFSSWTDEQKDNRLKLLFEMWGEIHNELLDIWETFPLPYSNQQIERLQELTERISEIDSEIEQLNPPSDFLAGWEY